MTARSVMAAMTRALPPQCSQWSTSKAKVRLSSVAHVVVASGEQTEVGDLVLARSRHEHGNAANEGLRSETEILRTIWLTIAEDPLHLESHETVFKVQAILGDGRAKDVSKQA